MAPSPLIGLTFENVDTEGGSIQITSVGNPTPTKVIKYSTDGISWKTYDNSQIIATAPGDKVIFASDDNLQICQGPGSYRNFKINGKHKATGSIESLTTIDYYSCYNLFNNCTGLTSAPELPAIQLAEGCYQGMFEGCTSLAIPPSLPATELASSCYATMFKGCNSLVEAPELPALQLKQNCYQSMFEGCSSLVEAPELSSVELSYYCYSLMFKGCTRLVATPELPAIQLTVGCYQGMFEGCSSVVETHELPSVELEESCYEEMFKSCSSLKIAPELPATDLAISCYRSMFEGCTSLEKAPDLPATEFVDYCYNSMFVGCSRLSIIKCNLSTLEYYDDYDEEYYPLLNDWLEGVSSTGEFYKNSDYDPNLRGNSTIPENWEIRTW